MRNLKTFENFDMEDDSQLGFDQEKEDETIFTIRYGGTYFGHVTQNDEGIFITHGQLGEYNEYKTFKDLFKYLSDFNISLGDILWE